VKLLRLEADVVLVPATTFVRETVAAEPSAADGTGRPPGRLDDGCLLDARRLLAESEEMLDRVRGTAAGSPATWSAR